MISLVIFKVNPNVSKLENEYWLKLLMEEKTASIHGFQTQVDAVRYFERGYRRAASLGAGFMAGAALYWMAYNPSAIAFATEEAGLEWCKTAIDNESLTPFKLSGMGGFEWVTPLHAEIAAPAWESGIKPELT